LKLSCYSVLFEEKTAMQFLLISLAIGLLASSYFIYQHYLKNKVKPISGGVYSIRSKNSKFQILKVLAISKKGYIHYLIYPSQFNYRPETLQISVMADKPLHQRIHQKSFHQFFPGKIGEIKLNRREIQRYLKPKAS